MATLRAVLFGILGVLALIPAASADNNNAGRVVFQMIGRNQITGITGPGSGNAVTVGYLTAIDGIEQPLFSNPSAIGENTAFFTFRTENYGFTTIPNGNSQVRIRTPGTLLRVYYHPQPNGNFSNLSTFSDGELIAVLRLGFSQATRVDNTATSVDGAEFVSSSNFTFGGKRQNLRRLLKNGITLFITGPAVPVGSSGVEASQLSFGGTAIRVGSAED